MSIRSVISSVLFFLSAAFATSGYSQEYTLRLSSNPLNIRFEQRSDSMRVLQTLQRICNQYVLNAYPECNVDSLIWKDGSATAFMHIGQRYTIKSLSIEMDSQANMFSGIRNRYTGQPYDSSKSGEIAEDLLLLLEDNGYPFGNIRAVSTLETTGIAYKLQVERGPYFTFDTCHIEGDQILRKSFLQAYTGIKQGQPYNEALFRKANEKLNQLPFLISERVPQLLFIAGGKAKPYFYLRKKRSDQINGIVGLAPSPANAGGSGNLVLTGEFTLRLNNLLKSAKVFSINWRSFKARSQELKSYFSYPYILSKPLGADIGIEYVKFDTLYTVFQRQAGLQYFTSGVNGFKVFYKVSSTNLSTVDTALVRSSKQFPSTNAIDVRQYGVNAAFNRLDYRFNPRKGFVLDATASVGSKEIVKDNAIAEVKFGSEGYTLYDSTILKTTQYQYQLKADYFFPLGGKSAFKVGVQTSQIIAPVIYFNELQREGGINSLKGFNEQSIFASNFNMLELEYRLLVGENSHFRVFWNGAYYEDKSTGKSNQVFDFPWGFGIGGNMETGAGILTLIYALGKEKSNPFDIRTGKFHFGLSGYF